MKSYLFRACEEIDAAIFSSDLLFQKEEFDELKNILIDGIGRSKPTKSPRKSRGRSEMFTNLTKGYMEEKTQFKTALNVKSFVYGELGFCGCFDFESTLRELKRSLEWCGSEVDLRTSFKELYQNEGIFYLIFAILDKLELIEHGTSIRHPWLTSKGKDLLAALIQFSPQEIDDATGHLDGIDWM